MHTESARHDGKVLQNQMMYTEAGSTAVGWMGLCKGRAPATAVKNKQDLLLWKMLWTDAWQVRTIQLQ